MNKVFTAFTLSVLVVSTAGAEVVGRVGDADISMDEIQALVKGQLVQLEAQRFELLEAGVYQIAEQKALVLEAAAREVTLEQLMLTEVADKVGPVSAEEIEQVYNDNQDELGDRPLEQVRPLIAEYLDQQRRTERRTEFVGSLLAKYGVEVGDGGRASRGGGKDAPVTIIGFSDYECPYCGRGEETVKQVLEAYGDKVRYVHRDFPLSFHQNAKPAAEAARCAGDQDKFWEFHDEIFKRQRELSTETYQALADELELDREKFDECVSSGKYGGAVDADMAAGGAAGVNGTPAFFINGRSLSGAQPFEAMQRIIDAELKAKTGDSGDAAGDDAS